MKKPCLPGAHGLPARHNYQPRYSRGAATLDPSKLPFMSGSGIAAAIEASRAQTYRGDVCTHCGDVVNLPACGPDKSERFGWTYKPSEDMYCVWEHGEKEAIAAFRKESDAEAYCVYRNSPAPTPMHRKTEMSRDDAELLDDMLSNFYATAAPNEAERARSIAQELWQTWGMAPWEKRP